MPALLDGVDRTNMRAAPSRLSGATKGSEVMTECTMFPFRECQACRQMIAVQPNFRFARHKPVIGCNPDGPNCIGSGDEIASIDRLDLENRMLCGVDPWGRRKERSDE